MRDFFEVLASVAILAIVLFGLAAIIGAMCAVGWKVFTLVA